MNLRIGTLDVAPGELGFGALPCGYFPDSSPINIPLLGLNGARAGKTLWVDSTMHGTEIPGAEVIRRLLREELKPAALKGAIVAAPILNPLAYQAAQMNTPQDGYNLNRVFPGDPAMLTSHRLAHTVYSAVSQCDMVIDLHANPLPAIMFSIVKRAGGETHATSMAMAEAFGLTTIQMELKYERHRAGTITDTALQDGKPALTVELLSWRRIEPRAVEAGVRGLKNVLKRLGMLQGPEESQPGDVARIPGALTRTEITAGMGGLVTMTKRAGEAVAEGETVALVRNPYGDLVDEVRSPVSGWILAYPFLGNQAVGTGDILVFIAFRLEGEQ